MNDEQAIQEFMESLFYLHKTLHKHSQKIESDIQASGMTAPQRIALVVLIKNSSLSLKELSQKVGLSHSTVSGIVDRLERKGLVKRFQDPQDRRFTKIAVTEEMRDFVINKRHDFLFSGIVNSFKKGTPEEQQRIVDGFKSLRQLLEKDE